MNMQQWNLSNIEELQMYLKEKKNGRVRAIPGEGLSLFDLRLEYGECLLGGS
jgi:hypothetical protein